MEAIKQASKSTFCSVLTVMSPTVRWCMRPSKGRAAKELGIEVRDNRPQPKPINPLEESWDLAEKTVAVSTKDAGRASGFPLKSKDASRFGAFLSGSNELKRSKQEAEL